MQCKSVYWIMQASNDDLGDMRCSASIVKGAKSPGQNLAYSISATTWRLDAVASVNAGFRALAWSAKWDDEAGLNPLPDDNENAADRNWCVE